MSSTICLAVTAFELNELYRALYHFIRANGKPENNEERIQLLTQLESAMPSRDRHDPWSYPTSTLLSSLADHYDCIGKGLPTWLDRALLEEAL